MCFAHWTFWLVNLFYNQDVYFFCTFLQMFVKKGRSVNVLRTLDILACKSFLLFSRRLFFYQRAILGRILYLITLGQFDLSIQH